jgi:hypothetical protein
MFEADTFFVFGIFYAALVCLTSMTGFWYLEEWHGFELVGDIFVICWIGVGMAFLAWMKVWMASHYHLGKFPSVSDDCMFAEPSSIQHSLQHDCHHPLHRVSHLPWPTTSPTHTFHQYRQRRRARNSIPNNLHRLLRRRRLQHSLFPNLALLSHR